MEMKLPYGKGAVSFELPRERLAGILQGRPCVPEKDAVTIVRESMENPIGSKRLWQLAQGKKDIVILTSDHTRPVPSRVILPLMLKELRRGSPGARIRILVATGCHRKMTGKELKEKFGEELLAEEEIVTHDCEDEENLVSLGTLPSGGELKINRLGVWADLLVAEGFIEPHFFAGFSGGRKSVLPGIASRTCVHYNHNSAFIDHPCAQAGILEGNPIHEDMVYAAKKAGLAYIVNVVFNSERQVIASFAGDGELAHGAGCRFVRELTLCAPVMADVVVTTNNGYPLDQNIYQMVKGISSAGATCKKEGVIIALGACEDGVGASGFYETFRKWDRVSDMLTDFRKVPPDKTVTDQWQSQILARILEDHTVILVSEADRDAVKNLKMIPAASVQEAFHLAEGILKKDDYKVTVIPEGISVVIG